MALPRWVPLTSVMWRCAPSFLPLENRGYTKLFNTTKKILYTLNKQCCFFANKIPYQYINNNQQLQEMINTVPTTVAASPSGASLVSNLTQGTNIASERTRRSIVTNGSLPSSSGAIDTVPTQTGIESMIAAMEHYDIHGGTGEESDIEGEEIEQHDMVASEAKEKDTAVEEVVKGGDDDGKFKCMLKLTATGTTEVIGELASDGSVVGSNAYNVTIPSPPSDYVAPPLMANEPAFSDVDNPGGWDRYYFQPKKCSKSHKYAGHFLPTGATPVPVGEDGKRKCGDWTFHYNGYSNGPTSGYRRGATTSNLFPKEMEGHLDANILRKLKLTKERMQECDALFFLQLLLPLCDTSQSGIIDDPRVNYYYEVARFTNVYALLNGKGTGYGHEWKNVKVPELVCFDGVPYCFLMEALEVVMEHFTDDGIQSQTAILRRLEGRLL